jgi:N-acetyl-gamma-glutamyl-phosphate reductase
MKKLIKVSVVGGSGYTGVELLRILSNHPNVDLYQITSRGDAGKLVSDVYPSLRGYVDHTFIDPDKADLTNNDYVFFATPNGIAMKYAKKLLDNNVRIIDLAADFRIQHVDNWEKWYQMEHEAKDELKKAVYGLPEINREKIKSANIVANPGCYPTATQLALIPLIKNNLIDTKNIIVDAKSGISGAGKKNDSMFLMSEASENFSAYATSGHRHIPEIEENLSNLSNDQVKVIFIPHLVPMIRGIHATIYVDCLNDFDPIDIFNKFYINEPFVDILESDKCPDTKSVRCSNVCRISFQKIAGTKKLVLLSVIDNLVKGAAGQAVQNMNIMMGIDETTGLNFLTPIFP